MENADARTVCLCQWVSHDEVKTSNCWLHGTKEGLKYSAERQFKLFKEKVDELKIQLNSVHHNISCWARDTNFEFFALVRLQEAIMWFERETKEQQQKLYRRINYED